MTNRMEWQPTEAMHAPSISDLEAEVERLKGAIDRIFVMAEEFTTRPLEPGESLLIRLSGIKWIANRARSANIKVIEVDG